MLVHEPPLASGNFCEFGVEKDWLKLYNYTNKRDASSKKFEKAHNQTEQMTRLSRYGYLVNSEFSVDAILLDRM